MGSTVGTAASPAPAANEPARARAAAASSAAGQAGVPWEAIAPPAAAVLSGLTAHHLLVQMRVTRPVRLHEHQGAALRGAFFGTLRDRFCVRRHLTSCRPCELHAVCPISALVATVDDASHRGADVPRPFSLEPPVGRHTVFSPGAAYGFGLTLFGHGIEYLPYALVGLQDLGVAGFGVRGPEGDAGRLSLAQIQACNLITGRRQTVYAGPRPSGSARAGEGAGYGAGGVVRLPAVPVTHGDVLARATRWLGHDRLTLRLLTPLRLATKGQPQRRLNFGLLLRRLVDRLEALALHYAVQRGVPAGAAGVDTVNTAATPLGAEGAAALGAAADEVAVLDDRTQWVEVHSYSARQRQRTPLGGLIGEITFGAAPERLAPFLPWLVWGEIAHAGKDATRGNGWYRLVEVT